MPNENSNHLKYELANAFFGTGPFKIILMANAFVFDKDAHANYADVSASELTAGDGYATGGATLANVVITEDDVNDRGNVAWDDVSWPASGAGIGPTPGAIIMKDSGVAATSAVVSFIDFGGNKSEAAGNNFSITNLSQQIN